MFRASTISMLVLGLVLTRLLGLHLHACAGIEELGHAHEKPHYADIGLVFGEAHADDHPDNVEVDLSATALPVKAFTSSQDDAPVLPVAEFAGATPVSGWLTLRAARAPPALHPARPDFFTPALRGPPLTSLA